MTTIHFDYTDTPTPLASGFVRVNPLRRVAGGGTVLVPSPADVEIEDGEGTVVVRADLTLWWQFEEHLGAEVTTHTYEVPSSGDVEYDELDEVDPDTLDPVVNDPAWLAQLAAEAAARSAADTALDGRVDTLEAAPPSATDLGHSEAATTVTITSSTGADATIPAAGAAAGVMTAAQVTALAAATAALPNKADLVGGVVPSAQIPAVAITNVYPVANQAAMLALTAERGDIAIRADNSRTYVLSTDSPGTLVDWLILPDANSVVSVNGQAGVVVLGAGDVGAAAAAHSHAAGDTTSGTFAIARIPTGQTGSTVPLGNDARFSDARTPTAHKTSHAVGGSDALTPADIGAATALIAALGPRNQPSHHGYKAWTAHPAIGAPSGGIALTFGRPFLTRFTIDAAAMAALAGGPLTSLRFVVQTAAASITNGFWNVYSAATTSGPPLISDVALGTLFQATGIKDVAISWTPPGVGDYYGLFVSSVGSGIPAIAQMGRGSSDIVITDLSSLTEAAGLSRTGTLTSAPDPLDRSTYVRTANMWMAIS